MAERFEGQGGRSAGRSERGQFRRIRPGRVSDTAGRVPPYVDGLFCNHA